MRRRVVGRRSYEAATMMMMTMMIMMSWARKWASGQVGQWERFPSYFVPRWYLLYVPKYPRQSRPSSIHVNTSSVLLTSIH